MNKNDNEKDMAATSAVVADIGLPFMNGPVDVAPVSDVVTAPPSVRPRKPAKKPAAAKTIAKARPAKKAKARPKAAAKKSKGKARKAAPRKMSRKAKPARKAGKRKK
jgi:hypothetical protein